MKLNLDKVIFEAPTYRNFDQLARGFGVGKETLSIQLGNAGVLDLVKNVLIWVRKDSIDYRRKSRVPDYSGVRFGKLTIVKRLPNWIDSKGKPSSVWLCRCECGAEVEKKMFHLKNSEDPCCKACLRIKKYGEKK